MDLIPNNYVWVSNIDPKDLEKIRRADPRYPGMLGEPGATAHYTTQELRKMGVRGLFLPANNRTIPQRGQ